MTKPGNHSKANRLAFKVALVYILVAEIWAIFSNTLLRKFISNPDERLGIHFINDFGFALLTGVLSYKVLGRLLTKWDQETAGRKQAEAARQESEERYHRLFAVETDAVMLVDCQTNQFIDVNPAAEHMYGFTRDEFLRLKAADVSAQPEETRNTIAMEVKHVPLRMHRRKDGTVFPVEISCSNFVYQDRKIHVAAMRDISQRNEAEMALHKSEARYRGLFENMNEGFAYCRMIFEDGRPKDFVYIAVNSMFTTLTGLKEVAGRRVTEVIPGIRESDPELMEIYGRVAASGKPEKFERFVEALQMWFDISVYSVEQDFFVAVFDVITERKETEEALRASKQLIEGIINAMPVSVFWKDRNLLYLGCNAAFARDAGFADPKDVIGKDDYQMGWRAQADMYRADDRQIIESGHPKLLIEEPQTTPKGSLATLLTSKIPLRNSQGEIGGVLGMYLDITERKQAEASHARLATAVEQAAETIVITDTYGTILYANPAFEKSSGYTRAEALGKTPRLLKSGRQDDAFYRRMWEVLKRGEVWSGHFSNRRKDGTLSEEEATISPVRDTAGKVTNFVAVKRDVTREVELEAQFRQAQKMQAIGQLASGVAHDFNNILAVIQLQAGLLKDEPNLSCEHRKVADEIEEATDRAANLTGQLLMFSRKQTLRLCDLDLNEVVTSITRMLRRIVGEDIQMEFKFSPHALLVHADAGMVDQILMNLTVNARDAMPKGGRLIVETSTVEFDEVIAVQTSQARPGSFACVSVTDTGCGMPPEILLRIFEPFFTTKEVGQGTGLGLATVFGIVQQHQGWINVYSEVGLGTTFRVYLPRLTRPPDQKVTCPSLASIGRGTETILLVEDDPSLRMTVRAALARQGYRVLEASAGTEALEVWNQQREEVQLLLTDLVMPGGMNGKDLARKMLEQAPGLKVIYVSGYSAEINGKDFQLEEGVNFLIKPFEAHRLAQTVRNCLDNK